MKTFQVDWIAFIFFRNAAIILLWTGFFHLRLKTQGTSFKYNPRPMEEDNPTFLFNNQTKDNLFYTFCSAIPLWTAYEVITFWAFANQLIPYVSWETYPIYCCFMFFLVPFIRDAHFYLTHRLLHWGPLYRIAHKVHHRNTNTGAWSGMSMHPIEHILYFSGILIHWIIPSHPLVAMYHVFHAGLAPTPGHTGYEKMTFKNGVSVPTGDYMHYIHHKYFECNYSGGNTSFLDKLMGTFHDGSDEATKEVMARIKDKAHYL
jgi:sterol desaturase/sphingolipid hydroxylase (fatty acid hydroxylase superfamily)